MGCIMCKEVTIYNERIEIVPMGKRVSINKITFYGKIKDSDIFTYQGMFFILIGGAL